MKIKTGLENRKYLVVGLGKTGISTAKFLHSKGTELRISEKSDGSNMREEIEEFRSLGIVIELGRHSEDMFLWADTIILSPGVTFNLPIVKLAIEKGKEVISEIELAGRFITKPVIAITGSNGKTTTTSLIYNILAGSGHRVFLGGNIGTPLIEIAERDYDYDLILLELSSFQLQGIVNFKPFVSVCLNIYPNHLDHHADLNEYINSKMNIFCNQDNSDWSVINGSDLYIQRNIHKVKSRILQFGYDKQFDAWEDEGLVHCKGYSYDLKAIRLPGKHNIENIMATILVCGIFDCKEKEIYRNILEFSSLPHRIEFIGKYKDANIYNDSKSTTPHATLVALQAFDPPVILIAGGKDKGLDYSVFKTELLKKVKHLILIGESSDKIKQIYEGCVPVTVAESLDSAVSKALAEIGDSETVLFSPACSSFDMFSSYEERGRIFREIVQNIQH